MYTIENETPKCAKLGSEEINLTHVKLYFLQCFFFFPVMKLYECNQVRFISPDMEIPTLCNYNL